MKKRTKIIGMAVLILNLIFMTAAGMPALSADPETAASDTEMTASAADPETSSSTAAAASPTARALSVKPTVSELVDPKNVLFISSFSLSYPSVESQIDGIREGIGDDVNIFCEFMDTKTIFNDTYIAKFYDYINYKYSSIGNVDAVIAGDDNALQMVLRYRSGFFRDIPVVFEAVDSESRAKLAKSYGIPGIIEPSTIQDNLDLAVRLYPDAEQLLAAVLRGLALELAAAGDGDDERDVYEHDVLTPDLQRDLAYGLEEGLGLDIADGAADLGDDDVGVLGADGEDALLFLVGYVGDNLYRAAGLASKAFDYAVHMGQDGTRVEVSVEGQTYALTDDKTGEFYYYDLYTGTRDLMDRPFGQGSASTEDHQG